MNSSCWLLIYILVVVSQSAELKRIRTTSKSKFTRAKKSLVDALSKKLIQKTVETRYEVLRHTWQEVQKCHDDYILTLSDEDIDENWIDDLCNIFNDLEVETDMYLESLETQRIEKEKMDAQMKLENDGKILREIEEINKRLDLEKEVLKNAMK